MSNLPPIRPRQTVGTSPSGPVKMDPAFARWLEQLARGVDSLNNGVAGGETSPVGTRYEEAASEYASTEYGATVAVVTY